MTHGANKTNKALRRGCMAGDRRAQQQLYQRYFGQLLGIPMRYTGDRESAVALMNEAFLQIFKALPDYQEAGSFAGWLSTITFRVTMDHLRFEQRYRERVALQTPPPPTAVANSVEAGLAAEDIYRYIQQLPEHLRTVFSLYVIDGYKHAEIASMIGITVGNSKWRLAKARETLQGWLAPLYNQKNGRSA